MGRRAALVDFRRLSRRRGYAVLDPPLPVCGGARAHARGSPANAQRGCCCNAASTNKESPPRAPMLALQASRRYGIAAAYPGQRRGRCFSIPASPAAPTRGPGIRREHVPPRPASPGTQVGPEVSRFGHAAAPGARGRARHRATGSRTPPDAPPVRVAQFADQLDPIDPATPPDRPLSARRKGQIVRILIGATCPSSADSPWRALAGGRSPRPS